MKRLIPMVLTAALWGSGGWAPEDWWRLREPADARIRADGAWTVYVERRAERTSGEWRSNLWLASADGKQRRQWTEGEGLDWWPRWSPDGTRIAWLEERGGKTEIHVRGWDGGEDRVLRTGEEEPEALGWSANGDAIAYVGRKKSEGARWAPADVLPFVRRTEAVSGIFVTAANGSGAARELAAGNLHCAGEPGWILDGQAVVAACAEGIYRIPAWGGAAKRLTEEAGRYESPVVAPDGAKIAYLFTPSRAQSYTVRKLYTVRVDGSGEKVLSGGLDRDAENPQWSSESRTVYFLADDRGETHVYAAHNDGTVRQATRGEERLRGLTLADNGRAASVRRRAAEAGRVVTFTVDVESEPMVVAAPNAGLLAERGLAAAEKMEFASDGHTIEAWLTRPAGLAAGRKYPLVVDVADDPRRMYGVEFSARAQMLAAAGYGVLRVNPRGTPGYGEEFGNLLRTRYPGDDFDDLMRGVDAAVTRGWVDGQRMYLAGGLLAAWALGHTNRFRGVIARNPVADWTADVAVRPDGERRAREWMGAMPWEDAEQYVKHSPIYFAGRFQTPALILAGRGDGESEELYFALRERKVDVEMVHLPEGARARVVEMEAMLAWMGR